MYDDYLYESYTNKIHSELKDTPNNVYHKGLEDTTIDYLDDEKIEEAFMHEQIRKVNKDRTINLNNKLYESPSEYKLQTIKLRYYINNPDKVWIYENNERKSEIKLLDKKENSKIKRKISFEGIINDESDVVEYEESKLS